MLLSIAGNYTLEWAAHGGGGVALPGGASGKTGCGTWCRGLVDRLVLGHRFEFIISELFSNIIDSAILWFMWALILSVPAGDGRVSSGP